MQLYIICLLYRKIYYEFIASYSKLRKTEIGRELKNKPCRPWIFKAIERSFREVFKRFSVQILCLVLQLKQNPGFHLRDS